jgi:large subunit ribosomal protein L4
MKTPQAFTKTGAKASVAPKLDKQVFDVIPKNHELLKQVYVMYLSNRRVAAATTKLRGEVRGGGRKPWRQKGTGRARVGSIRSPLWRGGGITFGPTGDQNYRKSMQPKAKRQALRQALSLALEDGRLNVLETFECKEGSVKKTAALLDKITTKGKVLLVVSQYDEFVQRATRNLPTVRAVQVDYLNAANVIDADTLILSQKSLDWLSKQLGKGSE